MKFVLKQKNDMFEKRLMFVKILFVTLFLVVFSGLFKIQVIDYSIYAFKDRRTTYKKNKIPVCRGKIYDRNGKILAMSVPVYSVRVDTWKINELIKNDKLEKLEKIKRKLVSCLNIEKNELEEKFKKPYALIKENISVEEYEKIKNLEGIYFERNYKRVYPEGRHCCHVVGFVGKDGKGLAGIELYYDDLLRGRDGIALYLKDGQGKLLPSIENILLTPEEGKDIFLTIDSNIQYIVEQEIKRVWEKYHPKSISSIVMDPESGEILAMANLPNFDPNFPGNFSAEERRNRCITDIFEPGSIFKIVPASAAIEEGIISPEEEIFCENGKFFVRGHYIHDVHKYENLSFIDVIAKSSNIGTIKIALSLKEERLYNYCQKFGFGQKTGIDLPGEVRGLLLPIDKWTSYSITAIPIGQEIGITAIQGIRAMSVLSNNGYLVWPHVVRKITYQDGRTFFIPDVRKKKILSERTCQILKQALSRVVSDEGTAPYAYIEGYKIYGKTGTAQKAENGRYVPGKYYSSFIGFISQQGEKLVISVNIDEPPVKYHYGGVIAAPVFRNILLRVLQYLDIPPSTLPYKDMKIALEDRDEIERTDKRY